MRRFDQSRELLLVIVLLAMVAYPIRSRPIEPAGPIRGKPLLLSASGTEYLRTLLAADSFSTVPPAVWKAHRPTVARFYELGGSELAWVQADGSPTPQAFQLITVLRSCARKGLNPADYELPPCDCGPPQNGSPSEETLVRFDVAVTFVLVRYATDIHFGRVDPQRLHEGLALQREQFDLAPFLRDASKSPDVETALEQLEPSIAVYRRTEIALQRYLRLADEFRQEVLAVPAKPIEPGAAYEAAPALARELIALGDIPADATLPDDPQLYAGALVEGVKHFQRRHGLADSGRLGGDTVAQLNVPFAERAQQLSLALERWRWLPRDIGRPAIVINIPEFRLRAFDEEQQLAMSMGVIVGGALGHQTPVFNDEMTSVVFRPYWNVPYSIRRKEIAPAVQRDPQYLVKHEYELLGGEGAVVDATSEDDLARQIRAGRYDVRQRPGVGNSLGLVKLLFPNQYDVYLHDTNSPRLFTKARRDLSHGCIRVEEPAKLTAWVLGKNRGWDLARVQAAMKSGRDNHEVTLAQPVTVLVFYSTARADENGEAQFFADIYGYDAALLKLLAERER